MRDHDPLPEFKATEVKAACRIAGLAAGGSKNEMFCRMAKHLETTSSNNVKRLLAESPIFAKVSPFVYRDVRVDELVEGEPTHNGYCTDRIEYIGKEPEANRKRHMYIGLGEYYVRFWFNGRCKRFKGSDTIPVSLRWLLAHDKKWKI